MSVSLLNPEGVFAPETYAQASVASGTRLIHLAGQAALDEQGRLVGAGDLAAQAEQAWRNVFLALRGAGARFDQVAKLTVYMPDWSPAKMPALAQGVRRAAQSLGFDPRRPTTLVGVASLVDPAMLVEVDAVAVLP